jgi:hypothetical protein
MHMCNSYESRSVSARAESYKKVRKQICKKFFLPPHVFLGSGIRDPGSGMGKKSGSGINIPDPQHCIKLSARDLMYYNRCPFKCFLLNYCKFIIIHRHVTGRFARGMKLVCWKKDSIGFFWEDRLWLNLLFRDNCTVQYRLVWMWTFKR